MCILAQSEVTSQSCHHSPLLVAMENQCTEELKQVKRLLRSEYERQRRQERKDGIPRSVKVLLTILVLMRTPWDVMLAIATCAMSLKTKQKHKVKWDTATIKKAAKEGMKLNPNLRFEELDNERQKVFEARRWVIECNLCFWILSKNVKGVICPAQMVLTEYNRLWGMGPHGPRVSEHLNSLRKVRMKAHWLQALRKKWHLDLGRLPKRAPMTLQDIKDKVDKPKAFNQFRFQKFPLFGSVFFLLVVPIFGTRFGSRVFGFVLIL